jgi:hypothetical protein
MKNQLSSQEIRQFIEQGFVRIDEAFSTEIAAEVVDILWQDLPFDRNNPETWVEPVFRLGMYQQASFVESVNSEKLQSAYNQLVGKGRWLPCQSVGTFPVRFNSEKQPNDIGKHVDASFPGENPADYFKWRVNVCSKGRALLMLVLYSNVGEDDAPTVIDAGSHADVARLLQSKGDEGMDFMELASQLEHLPNRPKVFATGKAGTVYLCHPFLVHSAQPHRGQVPKFMAQPPLLLGTELFDSQGTQTPLEQAIIEALGVDFKKFI